MGDYYIQYCTKEEYESNNWLPTMWSTNSNLKRFKVKCQWTDWDISYYQVMAYDLDQAKDIAKQTFACRRHIDEDFVKVV